MRALLHDHPPFKHPFAGIGAVSGYNVPRLFVRFSFHESPRNDGLPVDGLEEID
jgi:hypothetical protein